MSTLDLFGLEVATATRWAALFSAATDEWPTDTAVVEWWARRRGRPFALDVAANAKNAKAPRFYTALDNALVQPWFIDAGGGEAWCNPPYSDCDRFVAKAFRERELGLATVLLLPSRTDRPWFHLCLRELAVGHAEIHFAAGRLRFGDAKADAPFPSVVVVTVPG